MAPFLLGIMNANVLAAWLMALTQWLLEQNKSDPGSAHGAYGIAATVIIPILMGMTAALTWRRQSFSGKKLLLGALVNTLVGIGVAYTFLHEGTVCLLMAFPLIFGMVCLGTFIGVHLFRPKPGPLSLSVVPLLLVLIVADCLAPNKQHEGVVTTSVLVHAPAAKVFPHTIAFSRIDAPPNFLLNYVGLPWPVETTADAPRVGAGRRCIFSGDLVIGERITEIQPGHQITFAITDQPRYPEFTDHGKLIQGRISVTDNGDGTTTLTGTSWYTLHVFPSWYFGPWADAIVHNVHYRVFDHIKELSEQDARHSIR